MAQNLQPQRVAVGYFDAPTGKRVQVFMTLEWYKVLAALFQQVNANTDGSNGADGEDFAPLELALAQAGSTQGEGNEPAGMVPVLVLPLAQGLQALEAEEGLHFLQAQVAELSQRLTALEAAP